MMYIYLDKNLGKYPFVIPLGINQFADSVLWVHFPVQHITDSELDVLSHAVSGMKGVYWYRELGPPSFKSDPYPPDTTELLNTSDHHLIKSMVELNHTLVKSMHHRVFTRIFIMWLEDEQIRKVVKKRPVRSFDEAIALIPFNETAAWLWSDIVYGLIWHSQWYMSRPNANRNVWIFLVDEIISNYLKLTAYIGGIPSLPFKDINATPGWVFFGQHYQLQEMYEKLREVASIMSDEEFDLYYRRNGPGLDHLGLNV